MVLRMSQRHSEKETAKDYNEKVRGTSLNIGDPMLVANKAERGRRKLVDKKDPVVYTLVDRNLLTLTNKLKYEKGNMRIVQGTVESSDEDESILLSVEESEDEINSARSEFGVEDSDPVNLEERTNRWVNRESESLLIPSS